MRLEDFGESALTFALLCWIAHARDDLRIGSALRFAIDAAFRREGIEIPFPGATCASARESARVAGCACTLRPHRSHRGARAGGLRVDPTRGMQSSPFPTALGPELTKALVQKGFETLTPVQMAVLDPALAGRDLRITSQTGSGKTVAIGFALRAFVADRPPSERDRGQAGPQARPRALVVAPTRELAKQVEEELSWLYAPLGVRVVSVTGGASVRDERRALAAGPASSWARPGGCSITSGAEPSTAPSSAASSSTRRIACSTWASARTSRRSSRSCPRGTGRTWSRRRSRAR